MPNVILVVLMILALMVWRSASAVLHRRQVLRETAGPHPHYDNALQRRFFILERACAGVIAENGFDPCSDEICLSGRRSRAKTYLRRIVALTGARRMANRYILDVGNTRFHVQGRYVRRLRDSTDPYCGYEETCFYCVQKGMPREEEIATVLLQLRNNPALFDRWAAQCGAYKADGQVFARAQ
jgi:hypothetical protein